MEIFIKRTVDTSQPKKAIFGPTLPRSDQRPPKEPGKPTTQSVVVAADVDRSHWSHRARSVLEMWYLTGLSACTGHVTHVWCARQIRNFVIGDISFQNHWNNGTTDPLAWPSLRPNYNWPFNVSWSSLSPTFLTFLPLNFSHFVYFRCRTAG